MKIIAKDIADYIEEILQSGKVVPKEGIGGYEHGFLFGSPEKEIRRVCVCWSPTLPLLKKALAKKIDLIITHEFLFLPWINSEWYESRNEVMSKIPNIERARVLLKGDITVYTTHTGWDSAPEWGNADAFGKFLGFNIELARGRFTRIYRIESISLKKLAIAIKNKLVLPSVRVAGSLDRKITKVGTAIGGMGQLFGVSEEVAEKGAEVIIFGEALDYTIRFALEFGLGVIETAHVSSENIGVKRIRDKIKEKFPSLDVIFFDSGIPWINL